MALFMVERQFPGQVALDAAGAHEIERVNTSLGVGWHYSFLTANGTKTYCVYEGPDADAVREAARKAGLPADTVTELSQVVRPEQFH
jgi:hypothetical protein